MSTDTGDSGESALATSAERVLDNLAELEPELVGAAIFGADGRVVATRSDSGRWADAAADVLEALEAGSGDEGLDSAHIAMADGEVFAVKESGLALVAVTGRFVLASLTTYDMRMALRDAAATAQKADSKAENEGSENA